MKTPDKIDVKIGTPMEVLWTNIQKAAKSTIESCENEIIVQKELLRIADEKVALEQDK